MLDMVVGFLFDDDQDYVLLIQKVKPLWQKGKLNGIGGKIEPRESPSKAMEREFLEETGLFVPEPTWIEFCIINGPGWRVHFFSSSFPDLDDFKSLTKEEVFKVHIRNDLPHLNTIFNLQWLINLALDGDLIRPIMIYDTTKHVGDKKELVWK